VHHREHGEHFVVGNNQRLGFNNRRSERLSLHPSRLSLGYLLPSPAGGVLNPDTMFKDWFLPTHEATGIRAARFHELRHTFGARLIAARALLNYVKEQMGHASIQITVDTYGRLIPGVSERYLYRLDLETTPLQSATRRQPPICAKVRNRCKVLKQLVARGQVRIPDLKTST
jgi:Phage integrase family